MKKYWLPQLFKPWWSWEIQNIFWIFKISYPNSFTKKTSFTCASLTKHLRNDMNSDCREFYIQLVASATIDNFSSTNSNGERPPFYIDTSVVADKNDPLSLLCRPKKKQMMFISPQYLGLVVTLNDPIQPLSANTSTIPLTPPANLVTNCLVIPVVTVFTRFSTNIFPKYVNPRSWQTNHHWCNQADRKI